MVSYYGPLRLFNEGQKIFQTWPFYVAGNPATSWNRLSRDNNNNDHHQSCRQVPPTCAPSCHPDKPTPREEQLPCRK